MYQIRNRIIELKHITVPLSSNSNVSDIRTEIKRQKNNFRRIQRQNIYLAEAKELDKLESLARKKNKDKFWKFIKKNRKRRKLEKEVTIPPDHLKDHYSNFFKESNVDLSEEQNEISLKVKSLFDSYSNQKLTDLPLFKQEILDQIFKDLDYSTVKGFDFLSYNMIKKCTSAKLTKLLLEFYNMFIKLNVTPTNLNISIVKPIIKDQNKNSNDFNNIRPISISNCLAQIFE